MITNTYAATAAVTSRPWMPKAPTSVRCAVAPVAATVQGTRVSSAAVAAGLGTGLPAADRTRIDQDAFVVASLAWSPPM